MNITLEQAESVIASAKAKASEINTLMNIAVVDSGTNLIAFAHMDEAWLGSIDISQKKARTARYFNMPSGEIDCAPSFNGVFILSLNGTAFSHC